MIIDDLMCEMAQVSSDLFMKHVYHVDMYVVYIVQNLFNCAKNHRTMSLNANYIVLYKVQVSFLVRQVFSPIVQKFCSKLIMTRHVIRIVIYF